MTLVPAAAIVIGIAAISIVAYYQQGSVPPPATTEPFLDWYCGVSIMKLFGFNTDIHRDRNVSSATVGPLQRVYVQGFLDHDISARVYENAPCYYASGSVGGLSEVPGYIRNRLVQLRQLATPPPPASASAKNAQDSDASWNEPGTPAVAPATAAAAAPPALHGPFIALLANNNYSRRLEVLLYAPSHRSNGRVQPNRNALAIGHRWVRRLLVGTPYKIDDPRYYSRDGSVSHVRTCFGSSESRRDTGACTTEDTYIACGCIGPGCSPKTKYSSANMKRATFNDIYVAYEVRLDHSDIASLVTGGPRTLLRNMLPYNTEMYPRPSQTLYSENGAYAATLSGGTFRVNGTTILKGPGNATQLMLSTQTLSLETDQGGFDPLRVAHRGSAPFTLVLENDGRLRVYDYSNSDVTAPELELRSKGIYEITPEAIKSILEAEDAGDDWGWDANADYRDRIENLLNYLRLRDLLKNYNPALFASTPGASGADSIAAQIIRKRLTTMYGTFEPDFPYDPSQDYAKRVTDLVADLRRLGYPATVPKVTLPPNAAALIATRKLATAERPEYGTVNYEAAAAAYDPATDYTQRLASAGAAAPRSS